MAIIKVNNLNVTGSELFADSESYLKELSDSEFNIQGGICTITDRMTWTTFTTLTDALTF